MFNPFTLLMNIDYLVHSARESTFAYHYFFCMLFHIPHIKSIVFTFLSVTVFFELLFVLGLPEIINGCGLSYSMAFHLIDPWISTC